MLLDGPYGEEKKQKALGLGGGTDCFGLRNSSQQTHKAQPRLSKGVSQGVLCCRGEHQQFYALRWSEDLALRRPAAFKARTRRKRKYRFPAPFARLLPDLQQEGFVGLDFFLELEHPIKQCFCGRRAARHVDIHGHNAVTPAHHGVRVVVVPAPVGA